jgi:hypothetical protein
MRPVAEVIRSLLNGASPNGQPPEDFGNWRDIIEALHQAHIVGGTSAVRDTWNGMVRRRPELAGLISGDHSDDTAAHDSDGPDDDADETESAESHRKPLSAADRLISYALSEADQLFLDQFGQAHV